MSYKRILHATDLQSDHFKMCEQALAFAKYHQAPLYLIHVIETPQSLLLAQTLGFVELVEPAKELALTVLKTIADALALPYENLFVETGSIKNHVVDKATALHCDLIMVGRQAAEGFSLGSTTCQIAQHMPCDLLILR
ncbi:MAG: universal stress protein [Gammaproteobacteria bacterium]|nr:universal stress protein [Gammaproteobacteria bacterium]